MYDEYEIVNIGYSHCIRCHFFLSLRASTDIRLMAVSRAASFDGQFALLVACQLYLLFLFIIAVF